MNINNTNLHEYLTFNKRDKITLNSADAKRLQLAEFLDNYSTSNENRILYHITTTYKYFNRDYSEHDVNTFFRNLYTKYLLPYLHRPHRYTTTRQRQIQPLCLSFIDEHRNPHIVSNQNTISKYDRINYALELESAIDYSIEKSFESKPHYLFLEHPLHHHSILSVHPEQVPRMNKLCGSNTLVVFKNEFKNIPLTLSQELSIHNRKIIKTSFIRECEAMTLLYASKNLYNYPEFQIYPDSIKRNNNTKNKIYTLTDKKYRNLVHTRIHTDPSDINTNMHDVLRNTLAI